MRKPRNVAELAGASAAMSVCTVQKCVQATRLAELELCSRGIQALPSVTLCAARQLSFTTYFGSSAAAHTQYVAVPVARAPAAGHPLAAGLILALRLLRLLRLLLLPLLRLGQLAVASFARHPGFLCPARTCRMHNQARGERQTMEKLQGDRGRMKHTSIEPT